MEVFGFLKSNEFNYVFLVYLLLTFVFLEIRIPTRGETVLGNKHLVGPGGKGSNQAIAAARLEGNVNFITKIGKDSNAEMAL